MVNLHRHTDVVWWHSALLNASHLVPRLILKQSCDTQQGVQLKNKIETGLNLYNTCINGTFYTYFEPIWTLLPEDVAVLTLWGIGPCNVGTPHV